MAPAWARSDKQHAERPPDNFDDYGDFVATVVGRYKGRVNHFQIWNEPNLGEEWTGKPDPERIQAVKKAIAGSNLGSDAKDSIKSALSPSFYTGRLNRFSVKDALETQIVVRGARVSSGEATVLTAPDIHARNTFEQRQAVFPKTQRVEIKGDSWTFRLPAASVTKLDLRLV